MNSTNADSARIRARTLIPTMTQLIDHLISGLRVLKAQPETRRRLRMLMISVLEDVTIFGLSVLLMVSLWKPRPNAFELTLLEFVTLALVGMGAYAILKTILRFVLRDRLREDQDILRPKSGSLIIDVCLWLVDPRNTVRCYGFVVLLSSASAFLPESAWFPLPSWLEISGLYAAVLVLFASWCLFAETFIPSLKHHVLLGTGEHAIQRACWFAAVYLTALAIVWLGITIRQ